MYHFTPLTCCMTILENEEGGKKGRGAVDAHMVLTAVQQVQWHLLFYFYLQYSCRYMRYELAGRPLWCVTLNEYSPTWGDPSKQKKKGGGEKELTSQSKIWESISSVSILKWEKSSGWRWMILRRWRIEVCWTAPWFFNLWINSRVFGRKSEKRSVDLAMRRNSPTIAE